MTTLMTKSLTISSITIEYVKNLPIGTQFTSTSLAKTLKMTDSIGGISGVLSRLSTSGLIKKVDEIKTSKKDYTNVTYLYEVINPNAVISYQKYKNDKTITTSGSNGSISNIFSSTDVTDFDKIRNLLFTIESQQNKPVDIMQFSVADLLKALELKTKGIS